MAAVAIAAAFIAPWGAVTAQPGPTPQNLDVSVLSEGFEGFWPANPWDAYDVNASSGLDSWGQTNFRAQSGTSSLWSAGNGSQLEWWDAGPIAAINATQAPNLTFFHDDFEGNFSQNWTSFDDETNWSGSGYDTWGPSTVRKFNGNWSAWSAQEGYNDQMLDNNSNISYYDNSQFSYMYRAINLTNLSAGSWVYLDFAYWMETENCCDYLYVVYYDQWGWNYPWYLSGSSGGWQEDSVQVSNTSTLVGFLFYTDSSVIDEGVYLDNVTARSEAGARPAQPAGQFLEDFETTNSSLNWSVQDEYSYNGKDFWGLSTARSHSGTSSFYCAQVGLNADYGGVTNPSIPAYDSGMQSLMARPIVTANLTNFSWITFEFWYWIDSDQWNDYLYAMYQDTWNGSGNWQTLGWYSGQSNGWVHETFTIPTSTIAVGFYFYSDSWNVFEGAYLDDIEVYATRDKPNEELRTYDTDANATAQRPVDLRAYAAGWMEFSYWLDVDSAGDSLSTLIDTGSGWTLIDQQNATTTSWQTLTIQIPTNTQRIGFRFRTDDTGHAEGAYLDDLRVWGEVFPVNCTASVHLLMGMEGVTPLRYTLTATDGLLPYTYRWEFDDGANDATTLPVKIWGSVGTHKANVTIRDALGQTCVAQAPDVVITHDISSVSITPAAGTVVEGQGIGLVGKDAKGHLIDFDWALSPASCGVLSAANGPSTTFAAAEGAGGSACAVTASYGGIQTTASFQVIHDTTILGIMPSSAEVVEGETLQLRAVDRYGHALTFGWSASCGALLATSGSSTTFTAPTLGGETCIVHVTGGQGAANATIRVLHDTRSLTVAPSSASILEGAAQTFTVADAYEHPANATWAVAPTSCGSFSDSPGATSTFTASQEAGGLTCTVTATLGAGARSVTVQVRHDTSQSSLAPATTTVVEGEAVTVSARDRYGHPLDATWELIPPRCGELSATAASSTTTFTAAPQLGALACVIRAGAPGVSLDAEVQVTHGPAASLTLTGNQTSVLEGGTVALDASVKDEAGHSLSSVQIDWQVTCGVLAAPAGRSNTVIVSTDGGGQTCTVSVSAGGLSTTATFEVRHAGPFKLTVASNNAPAGSPQVYAATVTDRYGHEVPDAVVTWRTTCGALSAAEGESVTFTSPADMGGSSCRISASSAIGGSTSEYSTVVATGGSGMLLTLVALAGAGAVGALLVMRRKKGGGAADAPQPEAAGAPPAAPAPQDAYAQVYGDQAPPQPDAYAYDPQQPHP